MEPNDYRDGYRMACSIDPETLEIKFFEEGPEIPNEEEPVHRIVNWRD